jgi:hypothetical protein
MGFVDAMNKKGSAGRVESPRTRPHRRPASVTRNPLAKRQPRIRGVAKKDCRTADGIVFDSKKEMLRYLELRAAREGGAVLYFLRQVPFDLPGGIKYRIDFMIAWADGRISYEDVKGYRTDVYKLKKRQVEALYPITIEEV